MTKFYVAELQNASSYREARLTKAKSLEGAKRAAERSQFFTGTVLEVGDRVDNDGFITHRLAYKEGGHWWDVDTILEDIEENED